MSVLRVAWIAVFAAGCQVVTGLHDLEVHDAGTGRIENPSRGERDTGVTDAEPAAEAGVQDAGLCPAPPGLTCDLVTQCGCKAGEHCQALGFPPRPSCVKPGPRAPGSTCSTAAECPRGQTCDHRTCRAYCRTDADCEDGRCVEVESANTASTGINVCWERCRAGEVEACGPNARCRSLQPPRGAEGEYCAAPADPCPYVENGVCDEAKGTGECAAGTDRRDCACEPSLPDATCDLIDQCGCAKGSACFPVSTEPGRYSATCAPWSGTKKQNEPCSEAAECAPGHLCRFNGLCTRLCESEVECPGGVCLPIDLGSSETGELKSCHWTCDRAKPACGPHAQCVEFDDRFKVRGAFCSVPLQKCFENDGVCDEPEGSGICADGTDPVDCCRPSLPGGECNLALQCGCESKPGTSCVETGVGTAMHATQCGVPGEKAANNWCYLDADCGRGLGCFGNVCRAYCATDTACGDGGRCVATVRNGMTTAVKACLGPCSPVTNAPCGANTTCTSGTIQEGQATGCTFVPLTADCPTGNGRCDEPEGTGLCAEGSDPADCS